MKYLILSLLLVVGMGASGQTKKIKTTHTAEYRELDGKINFVLNELIDERVLASKLFDSLRNRDNMIEDQIQRDFLDIMQLGQRYWDLKRSFDSLRKEVDSLKGRLNYWPFNNSIHDPYINIEDIRKFNASDLYLQKERLDDTPDTITITTVRESHQQMKRFDKIKKVWVNVPRRESPNKNIDTATIRVRLNRLDPDPQDTIWMAMIMLDGNVCRPITGWYRGHEVVTPEIFDYMIWEKKTGKLLPIDSNGTYHDHIPTQLTVKKHKRAKRTPPATKD